MGIFSFFKKQRIFFSTEDQKQIVDAIQLAEKQTSGEIRIFVESRNPYVDPLERAREIFFKLKMENTQERNAVLFYIAMDHRELALFADEGIYMRLGSAYWDDAVKNMLTLFTKRNISDGIENCVQQIGAVLAKEFPYNAATDKNELPDDIVFGR